MSWGLSHVSVTARISIVLEIKKSARENFVLFHGANVSDGEADVAVTAGPGLRLKGCP